LGWLLWASLQIEFGREIFPPTEQRKKNNEILEVNLFSNRTKEILEGKYIPSKNEGSLAGK